MTLEMESFETVRRLLHQEAGHLLPDDKAYLVETRLAPLARVEGIASIELLIQQAISGLRPELVRRIVEELMIKETSFFRDVAPFEALRTNVIPALIQARATVQTLDIWCAACATGQEPYSLAVLLREHFPELYRWSVRLIGSDLSAFAIGRAGQGRYSDLEIQRGLSPELRDRYFLRQGDMWQVGAALRDAIEFRVLNLCGDWRGLPLVDLILLRNVMIYLNETTRRHILRLAKAQLRPDGYLLLGGGESLRAEDGFTPINLGGVTFYTPNNDRERSD